MKITSRQEINEIINMQHSIVVYGAGWAGKIVADALKKCGIFISCFAVMNIKNAPMEIDLIPVMEMKKVLEQKTEVQILLGGMEATRQSMIDYLEENKIKNYYELTDALICELRQDAMAYRAQNMVYRNKKLKQYRIGYLTPGYLDTDYAEKRLVIGKVSEAEYVALAKEVKELPCVGTEYETRVDDYRMIVDAVYCPRINLPEIDFLHVFNQVCFTNKPWIASFETCLPRVPVRNQFEQEYFEEAADEIIKDNCKGILAFCQNAYRIHEKRLLNMLSADKVSKIMEKTYVLHPPQEVLISETDFANKQLNKKNHFIFIGSTFFMKGGREVIQALEYFEDRYDFTLTLISTLMPNDYFTHAKQEDRNEWKAIIKEKAWIDYYDGLPNEQVLKKCKEATIGLIPSFGDTYGYACLEMQAAGCPVISTNVRAFLEINNEECGWICELPIDENGSCDSRQLEILSKKLVKELKRVFVDIFEHPEQIQKKGKAAVERIKKMHNPQRYAEAIRNLLIGN